MISVLCVLSAALGAVLGVAGGVLILSSRLEHAQTDADRARGEIKACREGAGKAEEGAREAQGLLREANDELARLSTRRQQDEAKIDELRAQLAAARAEAARLAQPPEPETPGDPIDELEVGMTAQQIIPLVGKPVGKAVGSAEGAAVEVWFYDPGTELRFVDGALTKWQKGKGRANATGQSGTTSALE